MIATKQKKAQITNRRRPTKKRIILNTLVGSFLFIIQFIIPHLYVEVCLPKTVSGFFMSPIKSLSFECQILRTVYYYYIEFLTMYKIVLSTFFVQRMWVIRNYIQASPIHKAD